MRPRDDRCGGVPDGDCGGVPDGHHARPSGAGCDRYPDADRTDAAGRIAAEVRDARPREVPGRLCAVAVELLPVTGASASLRNDGVPLHLCASSEQAARVAEIQTTLGDGPCVRAAETGAPVLACDLTRGPDADRWPVFAQQATAAGVRAVYALPLGNDSVCVGTLDLYRDRPGRLTDGELRTAELVAGVMTVALTALPHDDEPDAGGGGSWLSGLATDHDAVHQAIGMIMAQLGVGADEALARLRAHAFAGGRTALAVAREVIARRTRFDRDD
ncbi:GAF and ANTAR domain-containing protein [Streptomyces glaucus]|uniref:GAF domain-containing protein n=1 Tax=Streptomyces glaucus TaxID=284029 RepID=A0ABN3K190_9ACTN